MPQHRQAQCIGTRSSKTPFSGRLTPPGGITVEAGSTGTSTPARAMIATVNSCQEHSPDAVRWTTPVAPASTPATIAVARSAVNVG